MKGVRWYTAAVALSLGLGLPAMGGASSAAQEHPAASNNATCTPSNTGAAPAGQAAPPSSAAPSGSEAGGAPSKTIYPLVTVSVNGKQLATQGILINGRTLLPIIDLVDRLGGKAMWDGQTKTVWAAFPRQKRTIRMVVGSPEAQIYQYSPKDVHRTGSLIATTHMDQPPMLLGGYVVAPADAAANIARAKVYFNAAAKQVSIVSRSAKEAA